MVRKFVIALAATAAIIAGSALDASARMGGHSGGGGMGRGGMGHGGMGPGGFARMGPGFGRAAVGHPRFAFRNHRFHNRFHNRFFAFAGGYPYDSCYERIWTRWGWRLTYVCGGGYY